MSQLSVSPGSSLSRKQEWSWQLRFSGHSHSMFALTNSSATILKNSLISWNAKNSVIYIERIIQKNST